MIDAVAEILGDKVIATGFVQNWGGLTKLVCKTICVDEERQVYKDIYFPVTCNANNTCYENQQWTPIVPGGCTSLAYLEAGNLKETDCDGKGNNIEYEFNVRLVFWADLRKLGYKKTDSLDPLILCLLNGVRGQCTLPHPYSGTFNVGLGTVTRDGKNIFGRYHYHKKISKAMLYPFDYFAIDWKVKVRLNVACLEDEEICKPKEPLTCTSV